MSEKKIERPLIGSQVQGRVSINREEIKDRLLCLDCGFAKSEEKQIMDTHCPKCRSRNIMRYIGTTKYVTGSPEANTQFYHHFYLVR